MTALDDWGREIPPPPRTARLLEADLRVTQDRLARLEVEVGKMRPRAVSPLAPRHGWVHRLAETIADQWEVPVAQVLGRSRVSPLMRPRFVLAWAIYEIGGFTHPQVAQMVGYTDHTGVRYAQKRVREWRDSEAGFAWTTDQLLIIARRMRDESRAEMRARAAELAGQQHDGGVAA